MNMFLRLAGVMLVATLTGCASTAPSHDPFEGYNRAVFKFNDTVDKAAIRPVARVYRKVTPSFVQSGIGNFFGNLSDVGTAANNLLQGKFEDGALDIVRVTANSTLGILGFFDIASDAGVPKHEEDFGQTLGRWGVPAGPFVMLPFLGPSTLRDTAALPVDYAADPWTYKRPHRWRYAGNGVRLIDRRAALLDASNLLEEAALDPYEFMRDAYLQRRQNRVYDGDPPEDARDGAANLLRADD